MTKKKNEPSHGGKRSGAGRPSLGKRRNLVLDDERWAKAVRLGRAHAGPKGTATDGIRFALDNAEE